MRKRTRWPERTTGRVIGCGGHGVKTFKQTDSPLLKKHLNVAESHRQKKDIVPEPVEPGGVHPELGGQVDSQGQSAVHGVVEESPAARRERRRVRLGPGCPRNRRDLVRTQGI